MAGRWSAVLCVFTLVLVGASAHARDRATARERYLRGTTLYNLGRYGEAAREYEAAYEAENDPALLFNIGQAYRQAGDLSNALRSFRAYLRESPQARNREDVILRIGEIQRALETHPLAKEPERVAEPDDGSNRLTGELATIEQPALLKDSTPAEPPAPPPAPAKATEAHLPVTPAPLASASPGLATPSPAASARRQRLAGLSLMGASGASLAVASLALGLSKAASDDVSRKGSVFMGEDEDRYYRYRALGIAFFAIGGAAAVTGITLYVLGYRQSRRRTTAAPVVSPGNVGGMLGFRL